MTHRLLDIISGQSATETSGSLSVQFVDLGLPSGVLWADSDVEEPTKVGCSLPSYEQAQELIECCDFYLRGSTDGTRYIGAQGPSGQFVFFPLREYEGTPGPSGCCWCRSEASDSEFGYFLLLSEATITIGVGRRSLGFPCRLVRLSGQ